MDTKDIQTKQLSGDRVEMHISPMGRVEGDLDLNIIVEDGHVVDSWTQAGMFRGFEIILRGKDPQAGLIVTPRICGICGGSHLYKSCQALDVGGRHAAVALLGKPVAPRIGCPTASRQPHAAFRKRRRGAR